MQVSHFENSLEPEFDTSRFVRERSDKQLAPRLAVGVAADFIC